MTNTCITQLHLAAGEGNIPIAKVLLNGGANINTRITDAGTVLYLQLGDSGI